VAGLSEGAARAGGREPVMGQHQPGRRADLQVKAAQPVAHLHGLADQAGRDRVVVAAEGDQAVGGHHPGDLHGGRERVDRQGAQRLGLGQLADAAAARAGPGIAGDGPEAVQRCLRAGG
jgi:hypothetical protein